MVEGATVKEIKYASRAAAGARLLDVVAPGWADRIAVDELAMASCDKCILGQIYGDYQSGWKTALGPLSASHLHSAASYGFTLRGSEQDQYLDSLFVVMDRFAALAEAWRAEIRLRLIPAEVP